MINLWKHPWSTLASSNPSFARLTLKPQNPVLKTQYLATFGNQYVGSVSRVARTWFEVRWLALTQETFLKAPTWALNPLKFFPRALKGTFYSVFSPISSKFDRNFWDGKNLNFWIFHPKNDSLWKSSESISDASVMSILSLWKCLNLFQDTNRCWMVSECFHKEAFLGWKILNFKFLPSQKFLPNLELIGEETL